MVLNRGKNEVNYMLLGKSIYNKIGLEQDAVESVIKQISPSIEFMVLYQLQRKVLVDLRNIKALITGRIGEWYEVR